MKITAFVKKIQQFGWKCPGLTCISFLYYLSHKTYPTTLTLWSLHGITYALFTLSPRITMDEWSLIVSRSCQTNQQEYFLIQKTLNPISEVSEIGRSKKNLDATCSKTTVKKNTTVTWSNQQKHPKTCRRF